MANGKPGDHPFTDIVIHNDDLGERDIAERVRRLHRLGEGGVTRLVSDLLWHMFPRNGDGIGEHARSVLLDHLITIERLIIAAHQARR